MSITDKKNDVIEQLQLTDDSQLIEEVYELVHPEEGVESIKIGELNDDLQNKLNQALEDYHSGKYIGHEQMKQKVQQWLMK